MSEKMMMSKKEMAKVQDVKKKEEPKAKMVDMSVDKTRTYLYETKTRELANDILADGYVSPSERLAMEANHDEIIRDFLVSTDLLAEMEKNPARYAPAELEAARFVVNRLLRAREVSLAKLQEIKFANFVPPVERKMRLQRRKNKEYLDINFNLYQIFALNGSAHEVVEFARKQEKKRVMTPQQAKITEKKIMDLINLIIEKGEDTRYIKQFLENNQQQLT